MILKGSLNAECRFLKFEGSDTSLFNIHQSAFIHPLNSSLNEECRFLKSEDNYTSLFNIQPSSFILQLNFNFEV